MVFLEQEDRARPGQKVLVHQLRSVRRVVYTALERRFDRRVGGCPVWSDEPGGVDGDPYGVGGCPRCKLRVRTPAHVPEADEADGGGLYASEPLDGLRASGRMAAPVEVVSERYKGSSAATKDTPGP